MEDNDEVRRDRDVRRRRLGSLAVALVMTLGVGAVAVRWLSASTSSAPAVAVHTPAPAGDVFRIHAPPAGADLIWIGEGADQLPTTLRLRAVDWSGREVGEESFPCLAPCDAALPSPDGQRLLVREQPPDNRPPSPAVVFDARGTQVGMVTEEIVAWADDSRQLCTLSGHTLDPTPPGGRELDLYDPVTRQRRIVAVLPSVVAIANGVVDWQIRVCSPLSDRVVVSVGGKGGSLSVRVMQLSSGRLVSSSDATVDPRCACTVAGLAVGAGSGVAIENLSTGHSLLVDLRTGVATPWPGTVVMTEALGVSWSGRRAVNRLAVDRVTVAEIPSGAVRWQAPSSATVAVWAVRPNSDDLALAVWPSSGSGRVVIVRGDGSEVELPARLSAA